MTNQYKNKTWNIITTTPPPNSSSLYPSWKRFAHASLSIPPSLSPNNEQSIHQVILIGGRDSYGHRLSSVTLLQFHNLHNTIVPPPAPSTTSITHRQHNNNNDDTNTKSSNNTRLALKKERTLASLQISRDDHTASIYKDYIYVMGGSYIDDGDCTSLNSVERFSLSTIHNNTATNDTNNRGLWENVASMKESRCGSMSTTCSYIENTYKIINRLYVFGGYHNYKHSSTIEYYNDDRNTWEYDDTIPNMPCGRSDAAIVTIHHKTKTSGDGAEDGCCCRVYLIGGQSDNGEILSSIHILDLHSKTWFTSSSNTNNSDDDDDDGNSDGDASTCVCPDLPIALMEASAIAIDTYIIITGGSDCNGRYNDKCFVFDTSTIHQQHDRVNGSSSGSGSGKWMESKVKLSIPRIRHTTTTHSETEGIVSTIGGLNRYDNGARDVVLDDMEYVSTFWEIIGFWIVLKLRLLVHFHRARVRVIGIRILSSDSTDKDAPTGPSLDECDDEHDNSFDNTSISKRTTRRNNKLKKKNKSKKRMTKDTLQQQQQDDDKELAIVQMYIVSTNDDIFRTILEFIR